jgi:hypothetical protein
MLRLILPFVLLLGVFSQPLLAEKTATLDFRGKTQELHLYGQPGQPVVILSSGDLGWAGLVTYIAEWFEGQKCRVIGLNSKAYLTSFTTKNSALSKADVQRDFKALLDFAQPGSASLPILAGVSEGAGLSVLAATAPTLKPRILGVIALGLPNHIELGWKWQDFTIWFTKKNPDEPYFMVEEIIHQVTPVPLAEFHATHDEFLAVEQAKALLDRAQPPKRQWIIEAANHRFSDNRSELDNRLKEALEWIHTQQGTR